MYAKVKRIDSSDIDVNNYVPEDPNNFGFALTIHVGIEDSEGSDMFQLMVCTPDWFKSVYSSQAAVWGYSYLFVFKYDAASMFAFITKHIEKIHGENWTDFSTKIDRYASWEFQDYQEYVPQK